MLHITVNVIGMSVLYSMLLFFVMVADFVTGYQASKKEWQAEHPGGKFRGESKKGLRWVIKYFVYLAGFFILNVMVKEAGALNIEEIEALIGVNIAGIIVGVLMIARIFLMLYILRWELKSIDENFERLGFDFKLFDFFDNLIHSVAGILKSKTGVDLNKKNDDNK
jgi:hypothetical protein